MSEINDLNRMIHNSRSEGRAIQQLYDLRDEVSQSVNEDKQESVMFLLRDKINCIISLLEYKI